MNPVTEPQRKLSAVWLIPLAALLIGLWLVYSTLASRGPVVTLILEDAEGIKAGKTPVKTRNVQVGTVDTVTLSDDLSHTRIRVQMQADTERMLVDDTRFWVVKPRIGKEGISGLGTVLSGAYIELLPGKANSKKRKFQVMDSSPPEQTGDGLFLTLTSKPGSNIDNGDPVSYHTLKVGRVVDTRFDPDGKIFRHRIFIRKPYDVLVTDSTRFWKTSGIGFQLDASGFQAQMGSLESLIGGGIIFAVPDPNIRAGSPVDDDHQFFLHDSEEEARRALYNQTLDYVVMVERSVRGLAPGAPVEFRGIRIGTVEQVPWLFGYRGSDALQQHPIPVLIRLEPQRLSRTPVVDLDYWKEELARLVDTGLRASLKAGNLITGSLYIDLAFYPDSPAASLDNSYQGVTAFPAVQSGTLGRIEDQFHELLKTLNALPMEDISSNLNRNLANLDSITRRLETLLADPALNQLPQQLADNMNALKGTLKGWQAGGEGYREIQATLEKLNRLLGEAEPLLDTLNQQPNALIFQRSPAADPQPRGTR